MASSFSGCGIYQVTRDTHKFPKCASESTQADFYKCIEEKYRVGVADGLSETYPIIKSWDWKEAEEKK